jgi:uncharacterized protein (TIGR03437 family)
MMAERSEYFVGTIGGEKAFVDFVSPGQVDAQVPFDVGTGTQQITVETAARTSLPINVTVNAVEPGLLAPPSFDIGGVQYAAALFVDNAYVLPVGAIAGLTPRTAKPGDTIVFYGAGFGFQQANTIASKFENVDWRNAGHGDLRRVGSERDRASSVQCYGAEHPGQ